MIRLLAIFVLLTSSSLATGQTLTPTTRALLDQQCEARDIEPIPARVSSFDTRAFGTLGNEQKALMAICYSLSQSGYLEIEDGFQTMYGLSHDKILRLFLDVLIDPSAAEFIDDEPIELAGFDAPDTAIEFDGARTSKPLRFTRCNLGGFLAYDSELSHLSFSQCEFVGDGFHLASTSAGVVRLSDCELRRDHEPAVSNRLASIVAFDDCKIEGIMLKGCKLGAFDVRSSTVDRHIGVSTCSIDPPDHFEYGVSASTTVVGFDFTIHDSEITEPVFMTSVDVDNVLSISGNASADHNADSVTIDGTRDSNGLAISLIDVSAGQSIVIQALRLLGALSIFSCDAGESILVTLNHFAGTRRDMQIRLSTARNIEESYNDGLERVDVFGTRYDHLLQKDPLLERERIGRWLPVPDDDLMFAPGRYTRLAQQYRDSGYSDLAREVMILREEHRWANMQSPTLADYIWYPALGKWIGYGYRSTPAILTLLFLWIAGTVVFWVCKACRLFIPSDSGKPETADEKYRHISPLIYSLDSMAPLLSLKQENQWHIDPLKGPRLFWLVRLGRCMRWYYWFHVIAGWILTTLLVVALSGLIRTV